MTNTRPLELKHFTNKWGLNFMKIYDATRNYKQFSEYVNQENCVTVV